MYEAIILDTETHCIVDPEPIEVAWQTAHLMVEAPRAKDQAYFRPYREISDGATSIHHILYEDVEKCLPSDQAAGFVPQADYWIGHNVDFDWKVLGSPPQVKRICTLAMCRSIWPKCETHTLGAMMYFLRGKNAETRELVQGAHSAADDVEMCRIILQRIIDDEGISTFRQLWEFSEDCRIPKIMSFGKYKGQPVANVDKGWANWYVRQEDTDAYLIEALRRARKL